MAFAPDDELIRAPRLPTEVRGIVKNDTLADQSALEGATYKKCYLAIVDGKVPAVRIGSGWGVYRRDLPVLASVLRLRLREERQAEPKLVRSRSRSRSTPALNEGTAISA
ncbi:hypothetical protein D9599_25765 [Roseomonas sp. KE2513]|uniref:hypothetical protein n=1 Tax=Roseomonas sp. KE2513 TaxID=2479202 RepID=UPI0018E03C3B|nr:hypothetical protein [Roseomonas sp. KE2513]MBI0538965.1 hypothetical protein [Roseomonas sp. KE2513]